MNASARSLRILYNAVEKKIQWLRGSFFLFHKFKPSVLENKKPKKISKKVVFLCILLYIIRKEPGVQITEESRWQYEEV